MQLDDKYRVLMEQVLMMNICDDCVCCRRNAEVISKLPSPVLRDLEAHNVEFNKNFEKKLILTPH